MQKIIRETLTFAFGVFSCTAYSDCAHFHLTR